MKYLHTFYEFLNENTRMSGNHLILKLTPVLKKKLEQLKSAHPKHKFTLIPIHSDDVSVKGAYTLSYSGPNDDKLSELIRNLDESEINEEERFCMGCGEELDDDNNESYCSDCI